MGFQGPVRKISGGVQLLIVLVCTLIFCLPLAIVHDLIGFYNHSLGSCLLCIFPWLEGRHRHTCPISFVRTHCEDSVKSRRLGRELPKYLGLINLSMFTRTCIGGLVLSVLVLIAHSVTMPCWTLSPTWLRLHDKLPTIVYMPLLSSSMQWPHVPRPGGGFNQINSTRRYTLLSAFYVLHRAVYCQQIFNSQPDIIQQSNEAYMTLPLGCQLLFVIWLFKEISREYSPMKSFLVLTNAALSTLPLGINVSFDAATFVYRSILNNQE